ncbi:MAG: cytochrome c biogenesis CcdA family protein [Herminiimonas sp.]|uniref:cytochrome c biogenesis CcdA family protein n=1 Tax=Herminiimonas sp. TaxID=1926289 RepID=UPI0027254608|nr:cytochrome c biogenesis CcdA family protein [Herminiimonas sp.]MDO9420985.1 cytochrome c biogenesis CcdA family protein [Herminiimonas sp.]
MNNLIEAPLALLAGVLTIASPCVLPILPIVLGSTLQRINRTRPLFIVAGFVLTFAALGMLLASASQHVVIAHETLRLTGIGMLMLTGLLMLWRQPYEWAMARVGGLLNRVGPAAGASDRGNLGGFLLGMSLGAVWTPCAGPVLASILVLVAKAQDVGWSATLLILYAIGAGIPMLVIAYGGQFIATRIRVVARHTHSLQQVFGVLILLTGLAIYFQYDVLIYASLADIFPTLKGF